MRKTSFLISLIFLTAFGRVCGQTMTSTLPFEYGEVLNFEVSYGWLNLADAKLEIHKRPQQMNGEEHFKIDVFGKTKGAATIFGKVNDNWGTYLNKKTILPSQSYRHIEEGNYRKHEVIDFDQKAKKAYLTLYDRDNVRVKEKRLFDLPGEVQDIVSGFYQLRTMNLKALDPGETVVIRGFFDKEIYNIKLIYEGEEKIETVFGMQDTFVFSPQIPKNKLFRGEYPIKVWVTQDANKIPVRIKANLFLGSLNLDIVSAKGLINPY
ncbi:DUF3108 domain-containing protein [Algoriphagus namhaensis]|uniref:DUF3108 domain-containing protein n=1 Tax=Algoriphagus namhaensis TaxID=915353 RepID=A0ABV8AKN8_9BACT